MIEVELEWYEIQQAAVTGTSRQVEVLRDNPKARNRWTEHIEGCAGELAFAKAYNLYCPHTVNTYKDGGDVGEIQIRTRSKHNWDLIVRDDDRDEDVFVLVTGTIPTFRIVGWLYGHEAKKKEYVQTYGGRRPAYFVPQSQLRSMEELEALFFWSKGLQHETGREGAALPL